jgi:methionine sulfoxide reductase heme-binding subunit
VIHFYWLVKADIRRPLQYGGVLAILLGYRLFVRWSRSTMLKVAKKPVVRTPLEGQSE